jgi:hypothetical protein
MTNKMQNSTDKGITTKQQKAIAALLTARTTGAAAVSAGVSERTLYKWLADTSFRAALRTAESELVDSAVRRLAKGQEAALDTLETLIQKAKHESTRHAAAVSWLNLFLRFNEVKNIDERLTELEKQVQNGK